MSLGFKIIGTICLLLVSMGAAAVEKADAGGAAADVDYNRVRFNVMVMSNVRPQGYKTSAEMQRLVNDLKSWYANSMCGMEMEASKETGSRLKEEADKVKCGFVLQVAIEGIGGDEYEPEFHLRHGMLMKEGRQWKPLFDETVRTIPSTCLHGSESRDLSYNPALPTFSKYAVSLSSIDVKHQKRKLTISATVRNKLPVAVHVLKLRFPDVENGSGMGTAFRVQPEAAIPVGGSKKISANGKYDDVQALEDNSKRFFVEFTVGEPAADKKPAKAAPKKNVE